MDEGKRFWWIKVPVGFYDLPEVDWIIEQKNGCEYIILYQRLCHLAINTDGKLIRNIGEMSIPYDARKIAEVTKFKFDTVVVAMELLEKTKLIFRDNKGVFQIANFNKIVGSETRGAEKKRLQRAKRKQLLQVANMGQPFGLNKGQGKGQLGRQYRDNVPPAVPSDSGDIVPQEVATLVASDLGDIVPIEYRDKSLDIRNKRKDLYLLSGEDAIKSSDNFHQIEEELRKRQFSPKAIEAFLSLFPPETIQKQLINYDRCKKSIQKNKDGWFYRALQNDYEALEPAKPDPNCVHCHGTGRLRYVLGDTGETIFVTCSCLKK